VHTLKPQTLYRRLPQNLVQLAPVNADLGLRVTGMATAQLAVDELTVAGINTLS
jgi:hypothetical protein